MYRGRQLTSVMTVTFHRNDTVVMKYTSGQESGHKTGNELEDYRQNGANVVNNKGLVPKHTL